MEFPRLMYRAPGPEQCQGGTYSSKLVHSAEEFEGHLEEGWHGTLPEAINPTPQWMLEEQEYTRREASRLADEEANKANAERLDREQAEREQAHFEQMEADRLASEEAQRIEAERKAKEDAANAEVARIEAERLAAEKKEDDKPPTSEELRAKAAELGITVRKNATDESILAAVTAKLAEG